MAWVVGRAFSVTAGRGDLVSAIERRARGGARKVLVSAQPADHAAIVGDVGDEGGGGAWATAKAGTGNADAPHAAREGDISEATSVGFAIIGGKCAGFPGRQENMAEFEALGLVQGHQPDPRGLVFIGPAGSERGVVEQFAGGVKRAGELEEFGKVLKPVFGRLGLALAQHGAIAGRIEKKRESGRRGYANVSAPIRRIASAN